MENQIVKVNAADYGLDEAKAQEITKGLKTILDERDVLTGEYRKCIDLEITPENIPLFRDLRLRIRDNRTKGIEVWHKNNKAYFLAGGQFVDAIRRKESAENEHMEEKLLDGEKFFEKQEHDRLEKLRVDRLALLKPYTDIEPLAVANMEQAVFDNLLEGFKVAYESRIAAEKKAEEDRITKEKADAEEREKQRLENIRLQKEADERERQIEKERKLRSKRSEELKGYIIFIRDYNKMISLPEKEYQKEFLDIQRAAKEHFAFEAKEIQRKLDEQNKLIAKQAEERAQQIEHDRIEKEKKAKAAEEKKAKLAPDKDKLLNFMQLINDLPRPEVKSIEAADIASKVNTMLVQAANYIKDSAKKL